MVSPTFDIKFGANSITCAEISFAWALRLAPNTVFGNRNMPYTNRGARRTLSAHVKREVRPKQRNVAPANNTERFLQGFTADVGCGLFFVAFGVSCSAFAVVPFAVFAGSRSVLVLVFPCGGGFVCP